jgi:hypothetical protein
MGANTWDVTSLTTLANPQEIPNLLGCGRVGVIRIPINWATVLASIGIINPSNSDLLTILYAPAGMQITGAAMYVDVAGTTVASGGTATVALGDSANTAGYFAATSIKTASTYPTPAVGMVLTDAYGAATKVYSSKTAIQLLFGGNATSITKGQISIYLNVWRMDFEQYSDITWH